MLTVVNPPVEPATPSTPPTPTPTPPPVTPPAPKPDEPPVVPPPEVAYDLKLAADSPLDAKADVEKVVAFAKAHKLSNEQAQALTKDVLEDVSVRLVMRQKQQAQQAIDAQKAQYLEQIQADPVFGGAKYDATVRDVERMLNYAAVYLPDDVKAFRAGIAETPYGNFPPWVKIVAFYGKRVAEDSTPIIPGSTGGGKGPQTLKDALYPKKAG